MPRRPWDGAGAQTAEPGGRGWVNAVVLGILLVVTVTVAVTMIVPVWRWESVLDEVRARLQRLDTVLEDGQIPDADLQPLALPTPEG